MHWIATVAQIVAPIVTAILAFAAHRTARAAAASADVAKSEFARSYVWNGQLLA